jgi:uncharacterized membrane protein
MRAATAVSVDTEFSEQEVRAGRIQAALAYVVPFYLFIPLRNRKNSFAVFHARQALGLWLGALCAAFVLTIGIILLTLLLMSIPVSVSTGLLVFGVLVLAGVMAFVGARNAWSGTGQFLPYIGKYAETHLINIAPD